ncbi:YheC/YheD family protein [Pseudalkalibacillus berkeleyi]|uniref:YheC/YheD family protein n=1 Tax=Pseudalkalibacillus berkeleyi TaxID=1069813 RepID=A0ABS9GXQ1_9BACL|nr:YheC/YheD family protein [Pseudalkalibacillus berkeleyi]MCF6136150.1 YheC/YheD family protein [Pseudalkalibacillus berkeleyi]
MISLFFHQEKGQWFHREKGKNLSWGAKLTSIPYDSEPNHQLTSIQLRVKNSKIGPVIGIMASSRDGLPIIGNIHTFKRLIRYVQQRGGLAYVFSYTRFQEANIEGYTLHPSSEQWIKFRAPLPDFVYNRIPYSEHEVSELYAKVIDSFNDHSIPYFNRSFLSKWRAYLLLNQCHVLQKFLPETKQLRTSKVLRSMLNDYRSVMVKPTHRSKGEGIFMLQRDLKGRLHSYSNQGEFIYSNINEVWHSLQFANDEYIVQPYINRKQYEGRPFDYRILVQKIAETWDVTGYGIRWAGSGKLTTHVPTGGSYLPAILAPLNKEKLNRLASYIGSILDASLGPIGEFSIDLGIDEQNHCWIFEVNSKPMIFDEEDIQKTWEIRWYEQILALTGFEESNIFPPSTTHTNL